MKKFWLMIMLMLLAVTAAQADTQIVLSENGAQITGAGAAAENNVLTISQGGAYSVSGAWEQGQIVIKAGKDEDVTLTFAGAQICHDSAAALYCEQAGNVRILLAENTENVLVSGTQVDITAATPDENASGGALHVRGNLTIDGAGALTVGGYINNGIHCTDVLTVAGGKVSVEAVNNGLKGKDGVVLAGGEVRVKTAADAVQSDADLTVSGGSVYLSTGAGSGNADAAQEIVMPEMPTGMEMPQMPDGMQPPENMGVPQMPDGMQPPDGMQMPGMPGGAVPPAMPDEVAPESTMQPDPRADRKQGGKQDRGGFGGKGSFGGMRGDFAWETESADDGISRKGLKAAENLYVTGGALVIDTQDDALHAGVHIGVTGGDMTLSSGDDGLHADESLTIDAGRINILTAYEGIEAQLITVNGGDISLVSSDDGFNANGGANNFGKRSFGAQTDAESSAVMPQLLLNGGTIYVNAQGDGLDSNGDLVVAGGYVIVDGPQNGANGALDSGMENGGKCYVTGGTVLAVGAAGMSESFDENSTQCTFTVSMSLNAGDVLTIAAPDGTALLTHTLAKSAQQVVFSCPALKVGETYTVTNGTTTQTVSQTDVVAGGSAGGFFRRGW